MRSVARLNQYEGRADRGAGDRRAQRQTMQAVKAIRLLRAAKRVAIDARRRGRGVYEIAPEAMVAMCEAIDDAADWIDAHPGDAEAAGAIAGMQEAMA